MRIVLVANQSSGGTTNATEVAALLRTDGAEVDLLDIGDHERLAELAPDRVVIAGGDGSIGPVAAACAGAGLTLALVPTGTANDFARALDLPLDVEAAAALARTPLTATRQVELHRAAGRPFVNGASGGLSVIAAERADGLKGLLGPLAYAVGALWAGVTAQPLPVRVTCDGELVHEGAAWQVIVAGTGNFGGGASLDVTELDDGLLDVAVLVAESRVELVRRALGMRRGDLVEQDGVLHARGKAIDVTGAPEFNVDGELCPVEGGRFTNDGERFAVVVPGSSS